MGDYVFVKLQRYRQIYMVDPKGYIMNTVSLSSMEQKMFTKVVKFVKSVDDIK